MALSTNSTAVQLPLQEEGAGLAEWYHLVPSGEFAGRDGRGPYVLEDAQAFIRRFIDWGVDLCVDYEHQSLDAKQKAGPVPAAGWIKALEARENGIWARIDWTEAAASCLRAKEYRFLSPVYTFNPRTGAVQMLTGAGLTNYPNLNLQAAASRQGATMDELRERLCYLLNLPLTTTDEELKGHLDKLKAMIDASTAATAAQAQLAKAVGLAEGADMATVATTVQSRLSAAPDPAAYVPKSAFDQVSHSFQTLRDQVAKEGAERLVQEAMSSGKVPPALKDWATDYATRSPEDFKRYLETAPVHSAAHSNEGKPPTATGTTTLTPDQEAVIAACGLDRDAFLKTLSEKE